MSFQEYLYSTNKSLFIKFNWRLRLNNRDKDSMLIASRIYRNKFIK